MTNVYIPNCSSHDYSAALKYGNLVTVTTGNLDLTKTSLMYRETEKALVDSMSSDHIILSGANVINAIVCAIFVAKHAKLNLLIFQRNGTYVKRNMVFDNFK